MAKLSKVYTQKETATALNNALVAVYGMPGLKGIEALRRGRLLSYLAAAIDPLVKHVRDGHLTAEELTLVLQSGTLFVYALLVTKKLSTVKMPMFDDMAGALVEEIGGKDAES